jgi:hypothetical protein
MLFLKIKVVAKIAIIIRVDAAHPRLQNAL